MKNLAILLSFAALPFGAMADSYDERLAVANEYVENSLGDIDMPAIIRSMWEPIVNQVEASGRIISDTQKDELHELYLGAFENEMLIIMRKQPAIMADIMSLDEIVALRDFYATPVGRSVLLKMPKLIQAQQPEIIAMVQKKLPTLMPQVKDIVTR